MSQIKIVSYFVLLSKKKILAISKIASLSFGGNLKKRSTLLSVYSATKENSIPFTGCETCITCINYEFSSSWFHETIRETSSSSSRTMYCENSDSVARESRQARSYWKLHLQPVIIHYSVVFTTAFVLRRIHGFYSEHAILSLVFRQFHHSHSFHSYIPVTNRRYKNHGRLKGE